MITFATVPTSCVLQQKGMQSCEFASTCLLVSEFKNLFWLVLLGI